MPLDELMIAETMRFLESKLTLPGARLLEVGCGNGQVAQALQRQGASVRAIDISEKAIDEARARGVDAVQTDILEYRDNERFDAVIAVRSLHHVQPLAVALERIRHLLKPGGSLVLDDFAAELVDEETASWLCYVKALLAKTGTFKENGNGHGKVDSLTDPLEQWRHHHFVEHHVTPSFQMRPLLTEAFAEVEEETCPYLYNYVLRKLKPGEAGAKLGELVLDWEKHLIECGVIKAIGWRVVARG